MKQSLSNKITEKLSYVLLLFSLNLAYFFISILTIFHFLFNKKPAKDIILFPFAQKGSDGYTRRFEEYFQYLTNDKFQFYVCDILDNSALIKHLNGSTANRFYLYHKTIWKRIFQVLKARHYKYAFIQRGLFPFYYDQTIPYLEKLLRKLNSNITIDFWDAVWLNNPKLITNTIKYVDKITVVNEYGGKYFQFTETPKYFFPIGVNLSKYIPKQNYTAANPITFIYTGLPDNVTRFLEIIKPILLNIKSSYSFKLLLITRETFIDPDFKIECHTFSEDTFFQLLNSADIGLYAVDNNDYSKGKMAMKVLDYMSSALPIIATPYGLTPFAKEHENILFATNDDEWINQIELLIKNTELRSSLGKAANKTMQEKHELKKTYSIFKEILYS